MADIRDREFKHVDLADGTVVVAVPSVGLASTIAATFMISALRMDQVLALDSDEFPPLSMVYAHKPKYPVRLYASPENKLACFISEVPLPPRIHRGLSRKMLGWTGERKVRRILCLEGLPLPQEESAEEIDVWAVGSTEESNREIVEAGIPFLETGMVSGVAGVLLNEGRWSKANVIALLGEARPYLPDAHAAARLVEAADRLLKTVTFDLSPLIEQAKQLESHLHTLKEQARPVTPEPPTEFYR